MRPELRDAEIFWEQLEVAQAIVALSDRSVLPQLSAYLKDQDRHQRANAAFVFAGLGDERGFDVIYAILTDRSDRPPGQGVASFGGGIGAVGEHPVSTYHVEHQIVADRYYAAHVLGRLKDARAVPVLIPLLEDPEIDYEIPWVLADIGDPRAVTPLMKTLSSSDPTVRVMAIRALVQLKATQALPAVYRLLNDNERSHVDDLISVGDASREAIAKLQAR